MTKNLFKSVGRAFVAAFVFFGAGVAAAQAPARPPVDAFFQNPAFGAGKLSPNGRFVAVRMAPPNGRSQLLVLDVEKQTAKVIASYTDADVDRFDWVNDERLVYTAADRQAGQGDQITGPGLMAVNKDGSDFRHLVERAQSREKDNFRRLLPVWTLYLFPGRKRNTDDVFVGLLDYNVYHEWDKINILRLNTVTGQATPYNRPGDSVEWMLDEEDVPRVAVTYAAPNLGVHYLDPAGGKWRDLQVAPWYERDVFDPVGLLKDSLYVAANNGNDKAALYRYDLNKRALDAEPLVVLKDFDFKGRLVFEQDRLVGVRYTSDAQATLWLDPKWKEVQDDIDKLLPATINEVSFPERPELPVALVRAYSDRDPGSFMIFNLKTRKLTALGAAMPKIEPRQMATRDFVRYKARDGLEIPAWLTLPPGSKGKKLPMVVLVHGGPWVRGGEWNWDAESQFLASRGYAVLEPEFRGSMGYGYKHFRAGWKQWGLAMQNDVADGARWAIAQGFADASRVCIAGASYGGYATLMGLVNDPELYKCGINWVGVSDIDLMYSVVWSDFSRGHRIFNMPLLIGDREKDAEQLKATSPLQQAERIKQPVLMAYGGADRRVPIVHGTKFRAAVSKTNPNIEWVEYLEEGHGWYVVKNRVDFWTRVEKFLDKNIGAK